MKHVFLCTICLLWSLSATAKGLTERFNVRIGFFEASDLQLNYTVDDKNYDMTSTVQTTGLFGRLYAFSANYHSEGHFTPDGIRTTTYRYQSETKAHVRTKELVFDDSGRLRKRLTSRDDIQKTVSVDLPTDLPDAYDLQTVFALMIRQFEQNGFCDLNQKIFDGKRSYLVRIEDDGQSELSDPTGIFNGSAWKCSMHLQKINAEDGDMLWEATAERPIYFWIARDPNTQTNFLAQIEITNTPLGHLKATAVSLDFKD